MQDTIYNFFSLATELTILFIGISFLIYLFQGFIPYERLESLMNKSHPLIGAGIAVLFAFVTPFCSCSTIPIVVHLLRNQISFPIVMIFLFASPVLDLTILTLMTAILGWKVALYYTLITAVLSIAIGFLLHELGFEKQLKPVIMENYQPPTSTNKVDISQAISETWSLMKSVYPFLLIGAGVGAFIHGFVPEEWITRYMGGESWWLVPIAALLGLPLYIRLSTMIPISHMMIAKGMALGPVMALMISSAGASLPEVSLLHSIFKKKLVFTFVGSVIAMSTLSGFLFYLI